MTDWLDRYSAELEQRLSSDAAIKIPKNLKNRLLELARDVAHATERKNAPLAAFIAGKYAAFKELEGSDMESAVDEAARVASSLLPQADEPSQPEAG